MLGLLNRRRGRYVSKTCERGSGDVYPWADLCFALLPIDTRHDFTWAPLTWAPSSIVESFGVAHHSAKKETMLSTGSTAMTSSRSSSRCSHSRGRSRSRKITHNTITKTKKKEQQGENTTLRISDEDGNIVEIEADRAASMQEVFDCELMFYLFVL